MPILAYILIHFTVYFSYISSKLICKWSLIKKKYEYTHIDDFETTALTTFEHNVYTAILLQNGDR